jgi:hypothetical protein
VSGRLERLGVAPSRTSRRVLVMIEQSFPYSDESRGTVRVDDAFR